MPQRDYLRDPAAIYRQSFATVRREAAFDHLPPSAHAMAIRMIHACGMVDLAEDICVAGDAVAAGRRALQAGRPILVDCEMLARGIIPSRLPAGNAVICTLNDPAVPQLAQDLSTTRSAAAVDLWADHLEGAVVAIGNAPTALFRLLELLEQGASLPAAILGFPVGFVGAIEAKEELIESPFAVAYVSVRGRRGGSAIAAAAVNALAGDEAT